jgi:hypothetical protein
MALLSLPLLCLSLLKKKVRLADNSLKKGCCQSIPVYSFYPITSIEDAIHRVPTIGCGFNRVDDGLIAGATAQVARERGANLLARWVRMAVKQRFGCNEHSGRAEAALDSSVSHEHFLQGVEAIPVSQGAYGRNCCLVGTSSGTAASVTCVCEAATLPPRVAAARMRGFPKCFAISARRGACRKMSSSRST